MNVTETNDDSDFTDIERRLRAACAATIPRLMGDDEPGNAPRFGEVGHDAEPIDPAGRPRWWMTAVAVVLVVCAIGLVAQRDSTRPGPAADSVPPADSAAVPTTVGASTPELAPGISSADLPDPAAGLYLPSQDLPGFTVARVTVTAAPTNVPPPPVRYVRRSADGQHVEAMLTLRAMPADESNSRDDTDTVTVHGMPAFVGDTGEGIMASWQEDGIAITVRGHGLDEQQVLAFAEASVVDSDALSVDLTDGPPDGFERSVDDVIPPEGAVNTDIQLVATDAQDTRSASVWVSPNSDLETIDAIELRRTTDGLNPRRVTVRGRPALLGSAAGQDQGPLLVVQWIEDGFVFIVSGHTDERALLAFAESIRPATLDQVHALQQATTPQDTSATTPQDTSVATLQATSATTQPPTDVPPSSASPSCTTPGCAADVAVMIANANGIGGAAAEVAAALSSGPDDFHLSDAIDASEDVGILDRTIIYYDTGLQGAQDVALAVDHALGGGTEVRELPSGVPPVAGGNLYGAGVLVLLGRDKADVTALTP
jgi:LytR cell envelope-related transcriptional attenuator